MHIGGNSSFEHEQFLRNCLNVKVPRLPFQPKLSVNFKVEIKPDLSDSLFR